MKHILLLIYLISSAFAATIDTKLFEGENRLLHLNKIEQTIQSPHTTPRSKETLALEHATLRKLKKLYTSKDEIKHFEKITLPKTEIAATIYLKDFYRLSLIQQEIDRLSYKDKTIQEKLFTLKNSIEKNIHVEQNSSLLHAQLQYAFYKITKKKIAHALEIHKALLKTELQTFSQALLRVNFQKTKAQEALLKRSEKKIVAIEQEDLLLRIDKDSETMQDEVAKKKILTKEKHIQKKLDLTLSHKAKAQILLALKSIQESDQETFISTQKELQAQISTLSLDAQPQAKAQLVLLSEVANDHLPSLSSHSFSIHMKEELTQLLNKTLFVYEEKAFSLKTILTLLMTIMIGLIIATLYKGIIEKFRRKNRIKSLSFARVLANFGYYVIIIATFFLAFFSIGLDSHTIFFFIGAILLWVALGLQGFISNYAMGMLIKIDRSIKIGDLVELDGITGWVDDMNFRSITLQTNDQIRLVIPNARFISGTFINHSLEEDIRRVHIPFSADKMLSHDRIDKSIQEALKQSDIPHIQNDTYHTEVIITHIHRKINKYALLVWIRQQDYHDSHIMRSRFLSMIAQTLAVLPRTHNTQQAQYFPAF